MIGKSCAVIALVVAILLFGACSILFEAVGKTDDCAVILTDDPIPSKVISCP